MVIPDNIPLSVVPEYLGSAVQTVTEGGRLFAEHGGALVEVTFHI